MAMTGFLHIAKRQPLSFPVLREAAAPDPNGAFVVQDAIAPAASGSGLTLAMIRTPASVPREVRTFKHWVCSVGRARDNDLVLSDPEAQISRRHFTLAYRDGSWTITDLSTNGTFLNQDPRPIGVGKRRNLRDGDRIRAGSYEFEVRFRLIAGANGTEDRPHNAAGAKRIPSDYADSVSAAVEAYLERLLKLIPSEVVSIYPIGRALLSGDMPQSLWAVACLVICFVFRSRLTRDADGRPQWDAVSISCVSFIIWVYLLGSHIPGLRVPPGYEVLPALAMIVWTTLTPTIYMARSAQA
jgi:hypothetical protein